jgi:predicted metal-dependent TIM-barrel fold hydrolase
MKSGVPIVIGGGFYSQPWYPKEITTMREDQIVNALIKQADDDVVGAFGEIGSWDEISKDERKVFRAVGRAHVATNIPIFTHTGIPGKSALEQLDIFEDAGVDPSHVVIGHLGNLVDPNVYVHKQICRRGAFVGFDRQGGNNDAQQVPLVMALLEAGFADHLMFSADASSGYAKTVTVFLPKLKAAGATDEVLHKIMYDNPRRFLAFVPKRPRNSRRFSTIRASCSRIPWVLSRDCNLRRPGRWPVMSAGRRRRTKTCCGCGRTPTPESRSSAMHVQNTRSCREQPECRTASVERFDRCFRG